MKKLHYLSAFLLLAAGATSSYAQKWVVNDGDEYLTSIPVGVPVALHSVTGNAYLCGTGNGVSNITDNCAFVFEDAGNGTYRLKQYETNLYFGDQELGGTSDSSDTPPSQNPDDYTWMTENPDEAFTFFANNPNPEASGEAGEVDYETAKGLTSVTYEAENITRYFIFTRSPLKSDNVATYLGYYDAKPFLSPWVDTNLWTVSKLSEAPAFSQLQTVLTELFPNNVTGDNYPVGDNPGQISQELFNEAESLVTTARGYTSSTDETTILTMIDQLRAIKERLNTEYNPVVAGYYYIKNYRSDNNGVYAAANGVKWTASYDFPAEPAVDDASYLWEFIETEGGFAIRNYATGEYVNNIANNSVILPFTDTPVAHTFTHNPENELGRGDVFTIAAANHANEATWNADPNGNIVYWGAVNASGNSFTLHKVDESALGGLEELVEQNRLNDNLTSLYNEARALYLSGRRFTSDATADSDYTVPGLAEDASLLSSNAPETTEGEIANAVDLDLNTYFHTAWSSGASTEPENTIHYLQANLAEPVETGALTLKMTKRWKAAGASDDSPAVVEIQASTDGSTFTTVSGYSNVTINYAYSATYNDETRENMTTLLNVDGIPSGTQAIRMLVKNTPSQKKNGQGNVFFSLSEFHVYSATYNAESPYEQVPAEMRAEFETQMSAAEAELNAEKATQATIDALQAAYDNVHDNMPEPSIAREAVEAARTYLETAQEGEGIGYFRTGGKEAFQAVIDAQEANISDNMTLEQVNSVVSAIDAATAEFDTYLILPETGKLYTVQAGTSTTSLTDQYLYAVNVNTPAKWGGYDTTPDDENDTNVDPATNYAYLWFVESVDGTEVTLRNLGTGLYVGNQNTRNSSVPVTLEPTTVTLRYARTAGLLNVVVGDGMYLNSQEGSGNWVAWDQAEGTDNSAVKFTEFTSDLSQTYGSTSFTLPEGNTAQFLCLPYEVWSYADQGSFYTVAGKVGENLYLSPVDERSNIAAGTPFLYVPTDEHTGNTDNFYVAEIGESISSIPTYVTEPLSQNGLYGTLTGGTLNPGFGTFHSGVFYVVEENMAEYIKSVAPYQAYLGQGIPEIAESDVTDDMYVIEGAGNVTAIENVTIEKNEKVDVYTTSGVLVRKNVLFGTATNGLPAGIYIVGGQKVLVK